MVTRAAMDGRFAREVQDMQADSASRAKCLAVGAQVEQPVRRHCAAARPSSNRIVARFGVPVAELGWKCN